MGGGTSDVTPPTLETLSHNDGKAWFVNEPGLYQIIFRSDKPAAKAFTDWVTSEVLPTLRPCEPSGSLERLFLFYDECSELGPGLPAVAVNWTQEVRAVSATA